MIFYLKETEYKEKTFILIVDENNEIIFDRVLYIWYQSYLETRKTNNLSNQTLLTFQSTFKSAFQYLFQYLSNYYSLIELSSAELKTDDKLLYKLVIKIFNEIKDACLIEVNNAYLQYVKIGNIVFENSDEKYNYLPAEELMVRRQKHLDYIEYRVGEKNARQKNNK